MTDNLLTVSVVDYVVDRGALVKKRWSVMRDGYRSVSLV